MGRIHRIGQERDVYIFNFVAEQSVDGEPIVEGKILARLLLKLEEMRAALGNRVFDVIGQLLRLNEVDLEEMLREATYNPKRLEEYEYKIAHLSPERLRQLEEATGVALATSKVDLALTRQQDYRSEERRLMPQYVEQFFLRSAERTGLRVEQRADTLLRVEYVPERFRAPSLQAVRRFGASQTRYGKLTFLKAHLEQNQHLDAELLSPGHPLFAAVAEVLDVRLESVHRGIAPFIDPRATEPYRLHFFRVEIQGEEPSSYGLAARATLVHATLIVLSEREDNALELAPSDILHDLTPGPNNGSDDVPDEQRITQLERWVRAHIQHDLARQSRAAREREVTIRRTYLERSFAALVNAQQARWADLMARVLDGHEESRLARDEADKRVHELEARRDAKLTSLDQLAVVRPGLVRYIGSALVAPAQDTRIVHLMRRDDEVERIAMEMAIAHERTRGWDVDDISRLQDGSGFDLRSLGPTNEQGQRPIRRIEVKGRAARNEPVVLTPNEWLQAGRHGDSYWLYVVWGCKTGTPELVTIQNPVQALGSQAQPLIEVKGWLMPSEAIARATEQ